MIHAVCNILLLLIVKKGYVIINNDFHFQTNQIQKDRTHPNQKNYENHQKKQQAMDQQTLAQNTAKYHLRIMTKLQKKN